MLVHVKQSFMGTSSRNEKIHPKYCIAEISFVCDEAYVQEEILFRVKKYVEESDKFDGYTFDVPAGKYPNSIRYAKGYHFKPSVTRIKDMKMKEILDLLTGEQFAVFCREMEITMESVRS